MKLPALAPRSLGEVGPTFKRLVLAFLIFHFSFLIFAVPANAQTNSALTTNTNPDVPKNLHNWTQNVMIEVMAALSCQLTGIDPINPKQPCLGVDNKTGKIGFVPSANPGQAGGAIGAMGNIIAFTYTPAFHTGDYFGYLAQNFGITKPAYAANHDRGRTGTGFDSLSPIINLWIAFRNLVYLLFVAVFAIVGFGIMLRINIDPRTVMTIANQLPKMIIAILLVTFSFAISGGLIDLMWTSIYITTNVIVSADPKNLIDQKTAQDIVQSENPLGAANIMGEKIAKDNNSITTIGGLTRIADEPANALAKQMSPLFDNFYGKAALAVLGGWLGKNFSDIINGTIKAVASGTNAVLAITRLARYGLAIPTPGTVVVGAVATAINTIATIAGVAVGAAFAQEIAQAVIQLIAFLVIAIAILWALLRLSFQLIISYITVLIHVVFAPFWIIGGLFPGSPIGFGAWFREMLGSLSVFPVTIGMFLLGRVFMTAFVPDPTKSQFAPPMAGNPNAGNFSAFIGLGIILLTPQVVAIMKELFKSPQFKQGGAVAQSLAFGLGTVNLPQHAQKLGMYGYYAGQIKQFPIFGKFFGKPGGGGNVGGNEHA